MNRQSNRQYDTDSLAAFVDSGASLQDIADEVDSTVSAVRSALARRGMRATADVHKTLRARVETMRLTDAVEFLLQCIETLADTMVGAPHPVDQHAGKLTPSQRRMLVTLYDAGGALRTKDQLLSAIMFGRIGDAPEIKIVDVQVCKMRPRIPASFGHIETVWGQGYRFIRAEGV